MEIALNSFVFIIGAIIGSFLNVCIYRLPRSESIVKPSSHCPGCGKPIKPFDNIPIISYFLLKGRCRECGTRISSRYVVVEILTGLIFVALNVVFGFQPKFFAYSFLAAILIAISFIDLEFQMIPDQMTFTGLVVGPALALLYPGIFGTNSHLFSFVDSVSGMIVGGSTIFLLGAFGKVLFKKDAMGEGDIFLLAMIGAFLGWKLTILTFFIAPVFGSIVGLFLKYRYGQETIPYGPYLSLGSLFSVFFGDKILYFLFYRYYY